MLKHVVQLTGLTALAVALSVGSVAQAAPVASVLTGDEMAFAFAAPVAADGVQVLSQGEMQTTEGAVAPLVAIGIMTASRFIIQRYVTQTTARSMVQSAGNNALRNGTSGNWGVMATSRSQANNIAGPNSIREFHAGAGQRYTHYHTADRNGAHVWYGFPR